MEMDGESVSAVKGTVSKVFEKVRSGEGQYGKWWVQDIYLKSKGQEIKVALWNRVSEHSQGEPEPEIIPSRFIGKECVVMSQDKKGATIGVKINEYKDKKTLILECGKNVLISFPGVESDQEGPPEGEGDFSPSAESKTRQNTPQSAKITNSGQLDESNGVQKTRKFMMQLANLYGIAWSAAEFLSKSAGWDVATTKDVATSFFITANRQNYQDFMPLHPIKSQHKGSSEEVVDDADPTAQPDAPEQVSQDPEDMQIKDWKCHIVKSLGHEFEGKALGEISDADLLRIYSAQPQRMKTNNGPHEMRLANALITWHQEYKESFKHVEPTNQKSKNQKSK